MTDFKDKYMSYICHDNHLVLGFFEEYRFLSNFHVADVYYEGIKYPSSEHAYQAAKSNDEQERLKFSCSASPIITCAQAKKLGQTIDAIPGLWDGVKYNVMLGIVFDKFWRHPNLRKQLLDTGDRHLEETNHWKDKYWGVDYETRVGENNLGKILMKVRHVLKNS